MKTMLAFLFLIPLVACAGNNYRRSAAPGSVEVRVSAGAGLATTDATKKVPWFGQLIEVREQADGPAAAGRIELASPVEKLTSLGVYGEFHRGELELTSPGGRAGQALDVERLAAGLVLRQYLEGETVRPYGELRAGWAQTTLGDIEADGLTAGGALGVEFVTGARTCLFVQAGYDWTAEESFPGLFVGGSVRL